MNPSDRFAELLSLYLDSTLTTEQEIELLQLLEQPDRQDRFIQLARLDQEIGGLLMASVTDDVMVSLVRQDIDRPLAEMPELEKPEPIAKRQRNRMLDLFPSRFRGALVAVAVAVVLVLWFSLGSRASAYVPVLQQSQGTVHVIGSEGRLAATAGKPLLPGQQLVTTGAASSAVISYDDSTWLEVGPDTTISPLKNGGKKLYLARGSLNVEVAPQPAGEPLIVQTPQAEVIVVGTRFTLESDADATMIEVAKGSVQFTRSVDRKSIAVGSGTFAVASQMLEQFAPQSLATRAEGRVINLTHSPRLSHKGGVTSLAFSADSQLLASTTWSDGQIRLWHLDKPGTVNPAILTGHTGAVWSIAFAPDGKTLASGGVDKTVRLWDVGKHELRATLNHSEHIRAISFAPDGKLLATAGFDSSVRFRDPLTGQEREAIRENDRGGWAGVYALTFAPNGQALAVGISDRTVRLHNLDRTIRFTLAGHSDAVRSVAVSPDGKLLASASNHEVFLWDMSTGQQRHRLSGAAPVAFSANGRFLATGGAAPALWEPATGEEWARLQGHRGEVHALAFSPDGKKLALGGWLGITLLDWPAALDAVDRPHN